MGLINAWRLKANVVHRVVTEGGVSSVRGVTEGVYGRGRLVERANSRLATHGMLRTSEVDRSPQVPSPPIYHSGYEAPALLTLDGS